MSGVRTWDDPEGTWYGFSDRSLRARLVRIFRCRWFHRWRDQGGGLARKRRSCRFCHVSLCPDRPGARW